MTALEERNLLIERLRIVIVHMRQSEAHLKPAFVADVVEEAVEALIRDAARAS